MTDTYGARATFKLANGQEATYYRLQALEERGLVKDLRKMPLSVRVLLEAALRKHDGFLVTDADVETLAGWTPQGEATEFPFMPARVILQDFTGVPSVVDLAALRNAMVELGGDPKKVNPLVPVDLVIDHSVQVDFSGRFGDALARNLEIEYKRNQERYEFLKWGQKNLDNFRAVPPGRGIVHQVNLEWIATAAGFTQDASGARTYFPDSLVGTDSHTTMINGLGVLGWGVGGIEAEAVMLGQPIYMLTPKVVGFKLTGKLQPGVTATDMTLRIVELLRKKGVVEKFVEFYGPGVNQMALPDRATIANMAPEYGATCGYFPVDEVTLDYLRLTGRDDDHVENVRAYYEAQGMFHTADMPDPEFSETLELDLSTVVPSLAGPKRPQDRIDLPNMKSEFQASLTRPLGNDGHGLNAAEVGNTADIKTDSGSYTLKNGDVVIAAITSCTNTSNPSVMLAAGLLAKNAVERGLTVAPWVKPSLAPGSRVVTDYYQRSGLNVFLDKLGFATVGYGCTTCIGNSGPLDDVIESSIEENKLVVASVLSGNRNFEGRIHAKVKASFLASPPLVVAYALAGTVNVNLDEDPIGKGADGQDVYLRDIWPSDQQVQDAIRQSITPEMFRKRYSDVTEEPRWDAINAVESELYDWGPDSTYIRLPNFFEGITAEVPTIEPIAGARVLLKLGDSVTTDHISPAGSIAPGQPAAQYLESNGIERRDYNSYGSRRGNHEVMVRGTFGNVRIRNQVAPGTEGGYARYWPTDEVGYVYDVAQRFKQDGTPLVVFGGHQYGSGSSRDWAAKGTLLLGVRAVITKSFERIHRSNLVGMGVLPLCFKDGEGADELGLDGSETYSIPVGNDVKPHQEVQVTATRQDGTEVKFTAVVRLDTPVEVEYYRNGGILQTVLRALAKN